MKKLVYLIFFAFSLSASAQFTKNMFSKDPIINLENFQNKRLYFGYFLGFNSYDFKIDYKTAGPDIQVKKSTGFNVGIVGDLKLHEYVNLRFEPGLFYTTRELMFPNFTTESAALRQVNSTYIHLPLLLKFSSLRTGNIRPYILGGLSTTLNLSSNSKSVDDNSAQRFRVKPWTTNYELGLGTDLFTPYFIFSPSIRGIFGLKDELIPDNDPNSPWTSNIESIKSRAVFINFTFH
jgi:hypothetical protein